MATTSSWIVLRLRSRAGALALDYSDSNGRGFGCPFVAGQDPPAGLDERVEELAARARLAILLDPILVPEAGVAPGMPQRLDGEAATMSPFEILSKLVQSIGNVGCGVQTVSLLPGPWPERAPFTLPLNILTVGRATGWLRDAVKSRTWLNEIQEDRAGLTATGDWIRELLKRSSRGTVTDMMLCAATDLSKLSLALRLARHRPRLLVSLTDAVAAENQLRFARLKLPLGTSLLLLPFGGSLGPESEAVVELMRDFAHDLPLHEFGRRINRDDVARARPSMLFSRPEALDTLRLSHALSGIAAEILELSTTATSTGVDQVLGSPKAAQLHRALGANKPRSITLESIRGLEGISGPRDVVESADLGGAFFDKGLTAIEHFNRESDGLKPMASIRRALADHRQAEAEARSALADALQDPELHDAYMAQQARTVDVTMWHLGLNSGIGLVLGKFEPLVTRARYRIRVQVGRRSAFSIVSGEVPPIDLLLPSPEKGRRHILHVALYTDDFELSSPILQRLELPEIGPSPAIHFDVAPRPGVRNAQARIAVYYDVPPETADGAMRNHLVQTFLLKTGVSESANLPASGEGVEVTLEFSLNARFSHLEQLQSRLVSLALNDGPAAGTHKLMMKRGGDALPVNFTEAQLGASLKSIRDTLAWASRNDKDDGPRFPADQVQGSVADFDRVIWRLAAAGHALHEELFGGALGTPLEAALNAAAQDRDKIIQAVHLARNYAFPWTAVYDFDLPPAVVGGALPTVCKGFQRVKADGTPFSCADCLDNCMHPDKREAVCVYGFWGTRHQVEQLIVDKTNKPEKLRPIGKGAVAFTMGLTGRFLQQIPNDLTQKLGASARQIADNEDFLPTLWTDQRPAILLLVGHYRTEDVVGEPAGPRLTLPGKRFLQPGDILQQRKSHPEEWADPHSVILLAACSGAVVDITSGRNFANVFTGVGAGAVIGPEAVIYEGIARRFAVEMSDALVAGRSVGVAVLDFRRGLLMNLNPLGLVFTAYGFADLAAPPVPH